MASLPQERISILQGQIEQQRRTVETLKRDGHECADAERHLNKMIEELRASENTSRAS